MNRPALSNIAAAALFALAIGLPTRALAQDPPAPTVQIQEWQVPWPDTRPRDPYLAPDGRI